MTEPAKHGAPFSHALDDSQRFSRVSIADLLLVTLGTAIVIWFWLPIRRELNDAETTVIVLFAPVYGSAIAFVFVSLYRAQNSLMPFATQPGHMLLLLIGTTTAAIGLLARGVPTPTEDVQKLEGLTTVCRVACALTGAGLLIFSAGLLLALALGTSEESPRWRWVFQLIAASIAVLFLGGCCVPVPHMSWYSPLVTVSGLLIVGTPILLLAASIVAIVEDLAHRTPRDFWHWLGLAAFFGIPLQIVVLAIVASYSR